MPPDLVNAYQTFTMLATAYHYHFFGMMFSTDPPEISVIGNVTERGNKLVELFQMGTDTIKEKVEKGLVEIVTPSSGTIQ